MKISDKINEIKDEIEELMLTDEEIQQLKSEVSNFLLYEPKPREQVGMYQGIRIYRIDS